MRQLKKTGKTEYDFHVLLLVILFVVFGVVMVFSASYYSTMNIGEGDPYYYMKRQCVFAAIGMVFMFIAMHIDYHWYGSFSTLIVGASLILLLMVYTPLGITVNNATRWVDLGIRITPSELAKLAAIIFTSAYISEKPERIRNFKEGLLPLFVLMTVYAAMIIKQPNLSTAIVICAIMVGIMVIAGMHMGYLAGIISLMIGGVFYILKFEQDTHWYVRLTNFMDPFANQLDEGYQVCQSLIALGNGGVLGRGLGNSVTKYLYLPEPQNDFILAIIGEELGFWGFAVMMVGYLYLIYRGFRIALNAPDKMGTLIASGITLMLTFQVIINVAVVTASMPATGITLPFISAGGTSLITFLASMGILLNISGKEKKR